MKEFPPFRLDLVNQCLWHRDNGVRKGAQDQRILLTPKAFAMLRYLVEHAGRLVTQDELLEALWPETYVQPEVLKSHIRDIRAALGDDSRSPRFIETLPRRGYQFIAAVNEGSGDVHTVESAAHRLVGRNAELDRLRGYLERALRRERQLVFVTGEPGIGKTALVDAFQRQAAVDNSGLRIARGQCVEGYGGKEPYYPILEALGQLCVSPAVDSVVQVLAAQAPTWLVQFPALIKRGQREQLHREIAGAGRERMVREMADVLETITAKSPLLFVFEDLHWVDNATVHLLSVLARRRRPAKLMLVGTYRPVDLTLAGHALKAAMHDLMVRHLCREIALEPLAKAEVAEYLALESGGVAVPEGMTELIYRRSEGNPLFMVSALAHILDRGLLAVEDGSWQIKMPLEQMEVKWPESLRQMIELRIERLSAEEQLVLEVMSLLRRFPLSVTIGSAVSGLEPDTFEGLMEGLARRHQIIRPAGFRNYRSGPSPCYEFVHVLYRDVLYGRMGPMRRRNLHKRMAEWGEALHISPGADVATVFPDPEMADGLAHHFEQSGNWLRAIEYLQIAAETAQQRFEPQQAAETLEHVLELVKNISEPARAQTEIKVLQKLCTIYSTSFDPRALQTYEVLAERADHYGLADVEVHALMEMAFPLPLVSAEYYIRALDRALEAHLQSGEEDGLHHAAIRCLYLCRRAAAGKWDPGGLKEGRSLVAKLREAEDRSLYGEVHLGLGHSLFNFSEYREAQRAAVQGFADFLQGYDEPYLSWHFELHQHLDSSCPLFLGEWGEALRKMEEYIEFVENNGDPYRAIIARLKRVELQIHAMDFTGALQILESVFPVAASIPTIHRQWLIWAASAEAGAGNLDRALEHLQSCRNEMDKNPLLTDWYLRMPLQQELTEVYLSKGDLAQARIEAEQFLKVSLSTEEHTFRARAYEVNARIAMAEQVFDRAQEFIAKAVLEMEGYEVPLAHWRVHGTAAELYRHLGNRNLANHHRELSRATIMKLANSLPADEPLRQTFLSAPLIRKILGDNDESPSLHAKKG